MRHLGGLCRDCAGTTPEPSGTPAVGKGAGRAGRLGGRDASEAFEGSRPVPRGRVCEAVREERCARHHRTQVRTRATTLLPSKVSLLTLLGIPCCYCPPTGGAASTARSFPTLLQQPFSKVQQGTLLRGYGGSFGLALRPPQRSCSGPSATRARHRSGCCHQSPRLEFRPNRHPGWPGGSR